LVWFQRKLTQISITNNAEGVARRDA